MKSISLDRTRTTLDMSTEEKQRYKNLEISFQIANHNAAVETEYLGRFDLTMILEVKAANILKRKLSWFLEYAVCPTVVETRPKPKKDPKVWSEKTPLALWKLETGKWGGVRNSD